MPNRAPFQHHNLPIPLFPPRASYLRLPNPNPQTFQTPQNPDLISILLPHPLLLLSDLLLLLFQFFPNFLLLFLLPNLPDPLPNLCICLQPNQDRITLTNTYPSHINPFLL